MILVRALLGLAILLGMGGCTLSASLEEGLSNINSETVPPIVNKKNFFAAPADDSIQEQFVHGYIRGAKTFGSRMFVYGEIQSVGGYVENAAKYSTDTGKVEASMVDGDFWGKEGSKVFVGRVDEALEKYVIGTHDLTTGAKVDLVKLNGTVRQLKIHNGQLYILGFFTLVNSSARTNFAIVDASTGTVSATNISVVYTSDSAGVGDLAVSDDYIAIAADLEKVNSTIPNIVGKVALIKQQDGTVSSPTITGDSVSYFRLAFYKNYLFVGALNTNNPPSLMRLNLTNMTSVDAVAAADLTIPANYNDYIQHLVLNEDQLIVVGTFGKLGAADISGIFSVHADNLVVQGGLNLSLGSLQSTAVYNDGDSLIYAPQPYSSPTGIGIYRLNKSNLSVKDTYSFADTSSSLYVKSVFAEGDDLYFQGQFLLPRDVKEKFRMLGYDLESGKVLDWEAPEIQADWVSAWAIDGDWVYMAGLISEVNGTDTNGLVAFSLRTGEVKNFDISEPANLISTMTVMGNELYMTGSDITPIKLNLKTGAEQDLDISGRFLFSNKDHLIVLGNVVLGDENLHPVHKDLAVLDKNGSLVTAVNQGVAIWADGAFLADENTFYTFESNNWLQFNLLTGAHTVVPTYDKGTFGFPLTVYQGKLLGFKGSVVADLSVYDNQGQVERTLNLKTLGHLPK